MIKYFTLFFLVIALFGQEKKTVTKTGDLGAILSTTRSGNIKEIRSKHRNAFKHFSKRDINTGFLIDMSLNSKRVRNFNSENVTSNSFKDLYSTLFESQLEKNFLKRYNTIKDVFSYKNKDNIRNITIINIDYNYLINPKENKSLTLNDDVINFDRKKINSIVSEDNIFAVSFQSKKKNTERSVTYKLDKNNYFTNSDKKIIEFAIDFNDGRGFIDVNFGEKYNIYYDSPGDKELVVKIKFSNNTEKKSKFIQKIEKLENIRDVLNKRGRYKTNTWELTGTVAYNGGVSSGTAYQYFSGVFDKPIIVIEGFDPEESIGETELYSLLNQQNMIQILQQWGYDFVILDFDNSKDYIQRNAMLVKKLIETVNSNKVATPGENSTMQENIIIGASMGGLISKYALLYMEDNNIDHEMKTFITFDTPHQGANVPIGTLFYLDFWAGTGESSSAEDFDEALKSTAAKQMLYYNAADYPYTSSVRTTLQSEFSNYGDYPSLIERLVSISNGKGNGTGLSYTGTKTLHWTYYSTAVDLVGKTWKTPSSTSTLVSENVFDPAWPLFTYYSLDVTVSGTEEFDVFPGGTRSTSQQIVDQIPGEYDSNAYTNNPNHSFVPIKSALDLDVTSYTHNVDGDANIYNKTPFDKIYTSSSNEAHMVISSDNKYNFIYEITDQMIPPLTANYIYGDYSLPKGGTGNWSISGAKSYAYNFSYEWRYKLSSSSTWSGVVGTNSTYSRAIGVSNMDLQVTIISGNETLVREKTVYYQNGGLEPKLNSVPDNFELAQNFPNPFNPLTNIKFGLPEKSYVSIVIFNLKGQKIKSFLNKEMNEGYHTVQFNSNNLASGVYFARIVTPKFTKTIKMNLLK